LFKRILVLIAAVLTLGALAAPALADGSWDYYWHDTCGAGSHEVLDVARSDTTNWTDNQTAAIKTAIKQWNDARSGNCTPGLGWRSDLQSWHSSCSQEADVIVEKVGGSYLGAGIEGKTEQVHNGLTNAMNCAHVMISDYGANDPYGDESYYLDANPEPNNRTGEEGVLTHELGHALGSGHWQEHGRDDYCKDYSDAGHPGPGEYKTMCGNNYVNSDGEAQENVKVSLEPADINAFNNSYN
jgi:hypothetical protein